MRLMQKLASILLALACVGSSQAATFTKPPAGHPVVGHTESVMLVPGLDSWHKTHILSFPFPENEVQISVIQLVGKKNSVEYQDYFPGGVRPEGCLFCFAVDYDPAAKMMSLFLAEEDNCDEWADHLCDGYQFEEAIAAIYDYVFWEYNEDDWGYRGRIPDARNVDFLEWISVRQF